MTANSQQGFVSLFTAIMISMLLLIITLSLVTLETLQLRKAEDSEQTLRAYYAAEAGVEDAVAKIRSGVITSGTPTSCGTGTIGPASGGAMWTCQQVSFTGSPSGDLSGPPEEAAVTITPGKVNYNSVEIEWNQPSGPEPASYFNAWNSICGGACNFPSANGYVTGPPGPFAPPVELAIVKYPDGGFKASDVCTTGNGCPVTLQNGLFVPGGTAAGAGFADFNNFLGHGPWRANCAAAPRVDPVSGAGTSYNCFMVVENLTGGSDYLFRLRSRYLPTQYKMTFWTSNVGGGSTVDVPSGMAMIDVTARAGDAYRRVISELPLGNTASNSLNYVIYSDTDVCKNFDVINNVEQGGCPY